MVSVLTTSAVNRGFESLLCQIKEYIIIFACFSAKHVTKETVWLGIRTMSPSGETCLPVDLFQ